MRDRLACRTGCEVTEMRVARVRCDDCRAEFELFADLKVAASCLRGRPHRAVRIVREDALATQSR